MKDSFQTHTVNPHVKRGKYQGAELVEVRRSKKVRKLMPHEIRDWARSLAKIHNGTYHDKLLGGL